jgi:hypothetical protein
MVKKITLMIIFSAAIINSNTTLRADTLTLSTVADFQQTEIQNGIITNLSDGEINQNFRLEPAVLTITGNALPKELYRHAGCLFADTVVVAGGMDMTNYSSEVYLNHISGNEMTSWQQGPDLPVAVRDHKICRVGNYIYSFGGRTSAAVISTIYRSPINFQDKTLGAWQAVGNLPSPLERFALVKSKGSIYIIGGANGSPVNKVYFAGVDPSFNLLAWQETTALPYVAANLGAAVHGNEIWIVGGNNGFVDVANIYTSQINLDGSLGAWIAKTNYPLPISRHIMESTGVGLIVAGGVSNGTNLKAVYWSEINEDKAIIAWKNSNLADNLFDHVGLIQTANLYLLGGRNNTTPLSQSLRMPLNTWQPWKLSTAMTDSVKFPTAITGIHNYAYYTGGLLTAPAQFTNRIYKSAFQTSGGLGSWTNGGYLPVSIQAHAGVGYNSRMYILGGNIWGEGNTNVVYYSGQIDAVPGNVTSWSFGTPLPVTMTCENFNTNSLAFNDYIYVFDRNRIYMNTINSDGSLGSAWTQNNTMPIEMGNINPVIVNGNVYVFSNTNPVRVFYAGIQLSGNLNPWQETLSLGSSFGIQGASCVYKNSILVAVNAGYEAQAEMNPDGSILCWNRWDDGIAAGPFDGRMTIFDYNNMVNIFGSLVYPLFINPLKYQTKSDIPIFFSNEKSIQNISWQSTFPTNHLSCRYRFFRQQWGPWVTAPDFATDIMINQNAQYIQLGMDIEATRKESGLINDVSINYSDIPLPTPTLEGFTSNIISEKYTYVYPNPVRSRNARFRVYTKEPAKLLLKIFTPHGQFVYSREINANGIGYVEFDWECSNIANGVYFYQVEATGLRSGIKEKVLKKLALVR